MTIEEKNAEIARWMGYESNEDIEGEFDNSTLYNLNDFLVNISKKNDWETTEDDWTSWVRPSEMLFHSNWNWLCLVVEKIEELKYPVDIFKKAVSIHLDNGEPIVDLSGNNYNTKIEAVHEAVYQFIVWYNKNKDNEDKMY